MSTEDQNETPEVEESVTPTSGHQFEETNQLHNKWLFGIIIASFIFAVASIPLYRIYCRVVDPGGSAAQNGEEEVYNANVDTSRTLNVRFTTAVHSHLPWAFKPGYGRVEIHPGERKKNVFWAKNLDPTGSMTGKAIYDINPPQAGQYFKKVECFCFQEQPLGPGEEGELPLIYWFEEDIDPEITDITIAYTFFNMESSMAQSAKRREQANNE